MPNIGHRRGGVAKPRLRRRLQALVAATAGVGLALTLSPAHAHDYTEVNNGFMPPNTMLRESTPEEVGLRSEPIEQARAALRAMQEIQPDATHPLFPGAVAIAGHDGAIVAREASGYSYLYDGPDSLAPESERVEMRGDTIFDLASVSKLFTSLAAVQLVDEGQLDLDAPVSDYIDGYEVNGKEDVTVRMLLTHTTGLPAWLPLWSKYPTVEERLRAVVDATPTDAPGTVYRYSDLNLISLGMIVEKLRGAPLDEVVKTHITDPLGMHDTGYNPLDWPVERERIAATEWQEDTAGRGMVWGEVHDENAWSLDGVAGHAGVFSTADDLAILSQALLNGGRYHGAQILSRKGVELLITDFNEEFPGDDHGLGFELNQRWYMAGLSGPRTAGHTGYTGTSLVIDFDSRSFAILLTNRVHPLRTSGSVNPARRVWAQGLALAMPVRPSKGPDAWFTGVTDATTSTLTLPVHATAKAKLKFDLFIDTEETDKLHVEVSRDGGTTWEPLAITVKDRKGKAKLVSDGTLSMSGLRRYVKVTAELAAGDELIRWRSVTDDNSLGRGIYVDNVTVKGKGAHVDAERNPELFTAEGWALAEY